MGVKTDLGGHGRAGAKAWGRDLKRFSLFLVLLCALLVAAGLVPLAAQADTGYRLVGEVEPISPDGFGWLGPVAGDALGNVYVADAGAIYVYDAQGIWMTTISQWTDGGDNYQFNTIHDIAIDNNVLWVIDVGEGGTNRIVELSIQESSFGSFERSFSCGPGARAMAFDSDGYAWVLNVVRSDALGPEQETLNRFSPTGDSLGSPIDFSTFVTVPQTPGDLAIGPDDSVYVSMESYRDILVFNSEGAYQKSWSVGEYEHTQRIAVNAEGLVLVSLSSGVGAFTANGTPVTYFAGDDLHGVAQEVAVGATGDIYVGDSVDRSYGSRILVYRGFEIPTYTFVRDYPDPLASSDLVGPFGIAVDEAGNVYVADDVNYAKESCNVAKYDARGDQVWYVDSFDSGALQYPWGVAVHDGLVYVTDPPSGRIVVLDAADGSWQRDITVQGEGEPPNWYPTGIRFDASGHLWFIDTQYGGTSYLREIDTDGNQLSSFTDLDFSSPNWLALDADGNVYVADTEAGVFKFDSAGARQARWSEAGWLGGIDVDADGLVYVSNGANGWVDAFDSSGVWLTRIGEADGLGKLSSARGLTVALDGTIYVGDYFAPVVKSYTKDAGVDTTAPTVHCTLSGLTGVNGDDTGWFTGSVTAHISGTDPDPDDGVFGIKWMLYANGELLDSGQASETSTLDVTVPGGDGAPDGIYTLRVMVEDTHGIWSDWVYTPVQIDTIPPVTSFSRLDAGEDWMWWWTEAPFSLTATDIDGSGVARSEYQVQPVTFESPEDSAWLTTDGIYGVASGEGEHTLFYRSVDVAGNVEDPQTTWIGIDSQAPVITFLVPSLAADYFQGADVSVSYVTSDATSGVVRSGAWVDSSEDNIAPEDLLPTDELGVHSFTVWAVDNAGHYAEQTIDYRVLPASSDATPPSIVLGPAVYDGAAYGVSLLGQPLDFSVVDESGGSGASTNGSASVLLPGNPTAVSIPLTWTTNANGSTSATGTLPTGTAGTYTLTLSGRDQAGNLVTRTLTYYAAGSASPIAGLGGLPVDANGTPLLDVTKYPPTKYLTLTFKLFDSAGKPVNNASPRLYVYDTATGTQRFRALLPFLPLGRGNYAFLWFPRLLKWDPSWAHEYRDMQMVIKFYDKTSGRQVTATVEQGANGALAATALPAAGGKGATTPTKPTTTSAKIRVRW